jgi:hypothetical protein
MNNSEGYRQVFELVNQLPDRNIQELILQSPTWTDTEYENYLEMKNYINQSKLN